MIGTDARGQPVFSAAVSVTCRKQEKTQNIMDKTGQTVKIQTVYYLSNPVSVGDEIDGKTVLLVTTMTNLFGETDGYKAAV